MEKNSDKFKNNLKFLTIRTIRDRIIAIIIRRKSYNGKNQPRKQFNKNIV